MVEKRGVCWKLDHQKNRFRWCAISHLEGIELQLPIEVIGMEFHHYNTNNMIGEVFSHHASMSGHSRYRMLNSMA